MRIALVGDTHADETSRFAEHNRIMHWIGEDAAKRGVGLFLHSGDIWERKSTGIERLAVADYFHEWAKHAPVVVVGGNHDDFSDVEWLGRLRTVNPVTAMTRPGVVEVGGCSISCLPWPRRDRLLATLGDVSKEEANLAANQAMKDVLRGLRVDEKLVGPHIFLGHVQMTGSRVSVSQPPLVGCDFELGLDDLQEVGASFYALGHVHMGQEWDIDGAPVVYPSSPRRCTYGETEPKGYVIIEYDGPNLVGWERVPTPCTPMTHLDGTWDPAEGTLRVEWAEEEVAGAEVRLRYRVPKDHRVQAWGHAQEHRKEILACGAQHVKVEEVPEVVKRAKAPEVARARSVTEKLSPHWESIGFDPGERRAELLRKSRALEEEVGPSPQGPTSLRLHSAKFRALGPHREEFSFDLDEYPLGSVIALKGGNGSGKTSTCEMAVGGACHRKMPTQGTLIGRARARDSLLESVITADGHTYKISHTLDAVSGKSEALVTEDEQPVIGSTSVKKFDKWAAKHLPDPSVLYSLQFSSQPAKTSRPRFIDLDSAERISVLLKARGVDRIEAMAAAAREHRDRVRDELTALSARLEAEVDRQGDPDELQRALTAAQDSAAETAAQLRALQTELGKVEEENKTAAVEEAKRAGKRADKEQAAKALETTILKRRELTHRIANLEQVLVGADADEKLAADLEALEGARSRRDQIAAMQRDVDARREEAVGAEREVESYQERIAENHKALGRLSEVAEAESKAAKLRKQLDETLEEKARLDLRVGELTQETAPTPEEAKLASEREQLDGLLEAAKEVGDAVDRLPSVRAEYEEALENVSTLSNILDELRGQHICGAEDRIVSLRGGLENVTLHPDSAKSIASDCLAEDDKAVELSESIPEEIERATLKLSVAEERLTNARIARDDTERLAARRDEIGAARKRQAEIDSELEALRASREEKVNELAECSASRHATAKEVARITSELDQLNPLLELRATLNTAQVLVEELTASRDAAGKRREAALARVAELLKDSPKDTEDFSGLDERIEAAQEAAQRLAERGAAAARLEELKPQREALEREEAALSAKLAGFGDLSPLGQKDTRSIAAKLESKRLDAEQAREVCAMAKARVESAAERSGQISAIRQESEEKLKELADWERLALDFGRTGIQSAEVDAAGETLTELCNDILRACHGHRYTMSIDTSRLSADGKKNIDKFIVNVLDSQEGHEGDAQEFSGGERVFLGEAIEIGILILSCISRDVQNPTIVRDESMPALEEKNMRVYFRMLRHLAEKTRAANILLITHFPELREMCDAQISVEAGRKDIAAQ